MEAATIILLEKNPPVAEENKLALLGFCSPSAVFENTTVVRDAGLAGSEESSSEDRENQENVKVRLEYMNASNASAPAPAPHVETKNLVVLLHHALKQGLTFKLQGVGLRHVLGRTTKSTPLLLASCRLTNFVKERKGRCNADHKRENLSSGFNLGNNKAAIHRDDQITSSKCSLDVQDHIEMRMVAENQSPSKPYSALLREVSICNMIERSLQPCSVSLEALSFEDGQIHSPSAPSRIPAPCVSWNTPLNGTSKTLGSAKSCGYDVDAQTAFASKQLLSEILPDYAVSDHLTDYAIVPQHNSNKESKHMVSTRGTNAESTQDTPRSMTDKLGGKTTCQISHFHRNYCQPKSDHCLPDWNFNTRPDTAPNFFPSEQCPEVHRTWFEQSAKLQAPTESSEWPNQNLKESWNVNAGFRDSCLPRTLHHLWPHSPASRYQYIPEKHFSSHCNSSSCRFNPLAQSCPSVFQPLFHSQCQHTHGGQHSYISRLMGFPEHVELSAAASCSTCLSSRGMFPGSTPICDAQTNCVMQSYQCPSSVINDSFQHPSDLYAGPSNSEHVQLDDRRGPPSSSKPKKLLWLSEEEAEIIRLIRLSQLKDLSGCSSSYHASEQASPILSARMGRDIQDEVNLNEERDVSHLSSRVSSSSMEDFASRAAEAGTLNLGYMDTNSMLPAGGDQPILIDADCTMLLCNEKQKKEDASHEQRAASCIQHFWHMHTERKNKNVEEKKRLEGLKFLFEIPATQEHLLQMAVTAMKNGQLVSWHASICRAAKVIQRAWQEASRRKKETMLTPKTLPHELKEFYKLLLWRHTNRGFTPPTYEKFVMLMERLQAITEGARIRRRLKSRRLQTIVKEIREIRLVLQELSGEAGQEPSLNLLPQLSMQLQQKLLQLQTALSGPQDAARVLLRRCPATPLVLCSSKNVQAEVTGLQSTSIAGDAGSQVYTSGKSSNESFTSTQKSAVMGPALGKSSTESFTGLQKSKPGIQPQTFNLSDADIHGKYQSSMESDVQLPSSLSSEVVQSKSDGSEVQLDLAREMIEFSNKKNIHKCKVHVEKAFVRGHPLEASANNGLKENIAVSKSERAIELWQNSTFLPFSEKASDLCSVKGSSLNMEDSDYEDMSQNLDVPKHPFLRRKSKAMHPQKLDWSKVKPMVSSRLEPELKTRLLKAKFRGTALFRKVEQPLSELEKMFDGVIGRQGRDVSLIAYFGSNQQDSIIPRLQPNSNVFETSRQKMSKLHQLLSKEGCAGRLQHDCLSFVSVRD